MTDPGELTDYVFSVWHKPWYRYSLKFWWWALKPWYKFTIRFEQFLHKYLGIVPAWMDE